MSINRLPSKNHFDLPSIGKAGKAAKAAGAAASAGAAQATKPTSKGDSFEPTKDLGKISGAVAPTISLGVDTVAPLPKTEHSDALLKASTKLSPEERADKTLEKMAEELVKKMFQEAA